MLTYTETVEIDLKRFINQKKYKTSPQLHRDVLFFILSLFNFNFSFINSVLEYSN